MNDLDFDYFEKELRSLKPAAPAPFIERLAEQAVASAPSRTAPRKVALPPLAQFGWWLRWCFAPAAAVCLAGILWLGPKAATAPKTEAAASAEPAASEVVIDRNLVDSYELVADLPNGLPVRFRLDCWDDTLLYRDHQSGMAVERRSPRFEIVPVAFETY